MAKRVFKYKDVMVVDFGFCQLGMQPDGWPAKKRTRVMTNSPKIANRLATYQCDNSHWHSPLMGGRASACQVYPRPFCAQIRLGLKDELAKRQINAVQPGHLDAIIRGLM